MIACILGSTVSCLKLSLNRAEKRFLRYNVVEYFLVITSFLSIEQNIIPLNESVRRDSDAVMSK